MESNNGTPGDWVEIFNSGTFAVDASGFKLVDNDPTHTKYSIPFGMKVPAGGYLVVDEAQLGWGLDNADSVTLLAPDGVTLIDSYAWTSHAVTTYGRCPNGIGAFVTTLSATRGSANNCGAAPTTSVKFNEVESNGGTPGDWVEIINTGTSIVDVSGYQFVDNDPTHTRYSIPAGTIVLPGGYLVLEEAQFGFGLGAADSTLLFAPDGATVVDTYTWTAHASTTYGRCPNGTGPFVTTFAPTKGAANACSNAPSGTVKLNEVESNGGTPGDWVELINVSTFVIDISGFKFVDNDPTHTKYSIPAGTKLLPGGYLVLEEAQFGFGLGSPDSATLYAPDGVTVVDTYAWTAHASTTYGRCPNGTGAFVTTGGPTKGAPNNCSAPPTAPVKLNEVESNGGTPGDWVELINTGASAVDVSGYQFVDNDPTHTKYAIPSGTMIAVGGFLVLEEAQFGFGLGDNDAVTLFASDGATVLDTFAWTTHATTTYGRCPDGTGAFTTTTAATKGAANACPGGTTPEPWPGDAAVAIVDGLNVLGGNMSGLIYEGTGTATPGVLWAAKNSPGTLYRLIWNGTIWTPDTGSNWGAGKAVHYPDGTGDPDAESVTYAAGGPAGGLYVGTERNNANGTVSRNSILLFDPSAAGTTLTATREWNLTADLPVTGPNLGIEAITWIPDSFLVSRGFFDESKNHAYNPAEYPSHGAGLFFVGLEANGQVYAYALDHTNSSFTRIATIATGLPGVMAFEFDRELNQFWAVCDNTCTGRSVILSINAQGRFAVTHLYERPGGMLNINNEGFAVASQSECVANRKPAFWADDDNTDFHAIRRGTVPCAAAALTTPQIRR